MHVLAEFRKGIAHHRAKGATEERIKQILSASVRLAVQEVDDPELCAWICEEFSRLPEWRLSSTIIRSVGRCTRVRRSSKP